MLLASPVACRTVFRTLRAAAVGSVRGAACAYSGQAPAACATSSSRRRQQRRRHMAAAAGPASDQEAAVHPLLLALAIPPATGFCAAGSRVEHVLAQRDGLLSELITEALELPEGAAALLLRFGAIHTCPVPPALPPVVLAGMPPERAAEVLLNREMALHRAGNSSQARTPQRVTQDCQVPQFSYVRVHLHPKRFPAAYSVAWQDRIIADTPTFTVVSKPAGVPAAPTVDNQLECAPTCAAQAISHPQPLLITHRLDQCTEGLLVLGKSRAFVARFNELMKRSSGNTASSNSSSSGNAVEGSSSSGNAANGSSSRANAVDGDSDNSVSSSGAVSGSDSNSNGGLSPPPRPLRKFYRAATSASPPLGLLRHHLSVERRQLGLPAFTIAHEQVVEGSLPAELRVLEVRPIRLSDPAAQLWGAAEAHECLIELLTGRTHQIRAQLSAAGCPLLGDSLYQPLASPLLRRQLYEGHPWEELQAEEGGGRLLAEPAGGIGLQACRLEVADASMGGSVDEPAAFEAGPPWWRS